jgi:hypothetical protein
MSAPARVSPDDVAYGIPAPDELLWERRMRALTLRNAGLTYAKIGEQQGTNAQTARNDVRKALREVINETAEDMLARQRSVLADLQRAHYPAALQGDVGATATVLKCLEHEAKLFGLFAPSRVNVGVTDTEFAAQAVELITALGLQPMPELERSLIKHEPTTEVIDLTETESEPDDAPHAATDAEPQAEPEPEPEPDDWSNL